MLFIVLFIVLHSTFKVILEQAIQVLQAHANDLEAAVATLLALL